MRPVVLPFNEMLGELRLLDCIDSNECEVIQQFIRQKDLYSIHPGKYDISDSGIYALIQEYDTKTAGLFENHRYHIDIQYIIAGHELISYSLEGYEKRDAVEYDSINDIEFFSPDCKCGTEILNSSNIAIIYPGVAHKPCISVGDAPELVRKVVIKIPYRK